MWTVTGAIGPTVVLAALYTAGADDATLVLGIDIINVASEIGCVPLFNSDCLLVACKLPVKGTNGADPAFNILLIGLRGDIACKVEGKSTGFPELLVIGVLVF